MPPKPTATYTEALGNPRRHVGIHAEHVSAVSSTEYPGHYPNEDNSWDLTKFAKNLQVKVQRLSKRSIDFDLVGVDASIANAFRRIMIAEVPTVALETVYIWNNTSVVQDEILAHRLGLVPLNIDPALIEMKEDKSDQATDRNTIVFRMAVECTNKPNNAMAVDSTSAKPESYKLYNNPEVLSSHLEWQPQGEQDVVFADNPPSPLHSDIVLDKLRPGQEVNLEAHAVKGVGKDHAKFSPVAVATYRILPLIILNPAKPVPPELAKKFQQCFAPGVIRVDPKTMTVNVDPKALRKDTVSREVLRHPEFEGCVELKRVRDFFLFTVESESFYAPEQLLPEAIKVMRSKIANIRKAAEALLADSDAIDGK